MTYEKIIYFWIKIIQYSQQYLEQSYSVIEAWTPFDWYQSLMIYTLVNIILIFHWHQVFIGWTSLLWTYKDILELISCIHCYVLRLVLNSSNHIYESWLLPVLQAYTHRRVKLHFVVFLRRSKFASQNRPFQVVWFQISSVWSQQVQLYLPNLLPSSIRCVRVITTIKTLTVKMKKNMPMTSHTIFRLLISFL